MRAARRRARRSTEIVGRRPPPARRRAPKTRWDEGRRLAGDLVPLLRGSRRGGPPRLADPAVAPRGRHARDQRRGQPPGLRGRGAAPAVAARSSTRRRSAPTPRARRTARVDESWPATGIATSFYSRHKAAVEAMLDGFERAHPEMRIVRLRQGLIFGREAAAGIRRLFAGPFLPTFLLRPEPDPGASRPRAPRLPGGPPRRRRRGLPARAARRRRARRLQRRGRPGARLGELGADPRRAAAPGPARAAARRRRGATWRARLQPTSPGWVDLGARRSGHGHDRARDRARLDPRRTAAEALLELDRRHARERRRPDAARSTPRRAARRRVREILTGVGSTSK